MGFFQRILGLETRAIDPNRDLFAFVSPGRNESGVTVDEQTALASSAVWACVSVIANAIAALPVHVVKRADGERQYDHPVTRLLAREPNEFSTAPTFKETLLLQLLLWGAAYSYIERDPTGVPTALLPLRSDRTRPVRMAGRMMYQTSVGGGTEFLPPENILHVVGLSFDGITGISPIQMARQNIGLSLALEKFAARFFGAGCSVGGVLEVPSLKSDGMQTFAQRFRDKYASGDNSWKVAVLEAGMKFTPTSVDPQKAQAIEQRTHQLREVCRIYRVPPSKVADWEKSSYANAEQAAGEFVQDTLLPWIVKLEAECDRKLLLESEKPILQVKFNLDGLLRASTAERYQAHATGLNSGFLTVNEVRSRENLPPVPGGDTLRVPLNMGPADGSKQATPVTPPNSKTTETVPNDNAAFLTALDKVLNGGADAQQK